LIQVVGHSGALLESKPFFLEDRGFQSRSSRYVGTLSKSLTSSCYMRLGEKLRFSIRAVVGSAYEW